MTWLHVLAVAWLFVLVVGTLALDLWLYREVQR